MGNACDCFEPQPSPEEKGSNSKGSKKGPKRRRLSAQQLLDEQQITESPSPEKPEAGNGDDEEDGAKKQKGEKEPKTVEAGVITHEEEQKTEPEKVPSEKETQQEEEQQQPLLVTTETSKPHKEEEVPQVTITEPEPEPEPELELDSESVPEPEPEPEAVVVQQAVQSEGEEEGDDDGEQPDSSDDEDDSALVAGGSRLMRSFVDGCQILLCSKSSSRNLRIMENGDVNGLGGNGKKATFIVHVKGLRQVTLQNVKNPEQWLQVKDDELSGNGTGDEHCHFNLSEHGGFVVFEPVLSPDTHIGIRENGDVKKPSHTGTRKHARFTPIMKNTTLAGESPLLTAFKTGRRVFLTSRSSSKSLRIVDGQVNGLGGKGKKASFFVHVRRSDVIALQNVKDPQSWLRIKNDQLEGNGKGSRFCEFKVEENDGHVTLESVAAPGHYVGIDSEGATTVPNETDASSENAHFMPNVKLQKAGDSELLSRFTEENVIVLESRASGKTLRFRGGEVEGVGGHGALAQFVVHVKAPGVVALQNKKERKQWLRIMNEELNTKGSGGSLCDWNVEEVDGHVVLESVRFPGQHVGVRESGEVKKPSQTGKGKHAQFTPIVIDAGENED